MATYTFLTSSVKEVTSKINRIINKCKKQGIPYTFNVGEAYDKIVEEKENKQKFSVNVTDIELDVKFKFNGWTSLGVVCRKDGIVQCYFKDANLIKQYKDTDFHCDHCKRHAHRNSVVILEHENGERKVVGTSCVQEFTRGLDGTLIAIFNDLDYFLAKKDAELDILLQGESLDDMPISVFCERNGIPTYDVKDIVACASRLVRIYGYENSNSDDATWKSILDLYGRTSVMMDDKDAYAEAERAIAWIANMTEEEYTSSSYLFNLHQIIDAGLCSMRHFGIIASIIPAYQKSEYKRIMAEKPVSNFYGNVGDKFSLNLVYMKSISYDSQFGTGYFHFFTDDNGNIFKWSTDRGIAYEVKYTTSDGIEHNRGIRQADQGSIVKISGRIKDHNEYHGEKQTVITRCKYEVIKSRKMDLDIFTEKSEYESWLKRKDEQHPVDKALDCMEMWAQYREKYC